MFHLTLMGGSEVRVKDQDNIVITVWGGTEILLPTIAEKMIRVRQCLQKYGEVNETIVRHTNVITFMGGTSYTVPTLAQEIEEMLQLKESGVLEPQELQHLWNEVLKRDDLDMLESITIMGGSGEDRPSKKEELADLRSLVSRGVLCSEDVEEIGAVIKGLKKATIQTYELQEKLRRLLFAESTTPHRLSREHAPVQLESAPLK